MGKQRYFLKLYGMAVALLFLSITAVMASPVTVKSGTGKKVLVEFFTGTWCPGCPWGYKDLKKLQDTRGNIFILSYHYNDLMSNDDSDRFINTVMVTEAPTALIDRIFFSGYSHLYVSRENWEEKIAEAEAADPSFDLTVTSDYSDSTRMVTLDIAALTLTDLTKKYRLNVVVSEDSLNYRQKINQYETPEIYPYYHMNVYRKAVTGPYGEPFIDSAVARGVTLRKSYTFALPLDIAVDHAHIAVFIHENLANSIGPVQQIVLFPIKVSGQQTAVREASEPMEFRLSANRPNPFNPSTAIDYTVARSGGVEISVYDILGRRVRTLVNAPHVPGDYTVVWDGRDEKGETVSGGVYLYWMRSGSGILTHKMLLLK